MRAKLISLLALAAAGFATIGQAETQCSSCPDTLSLTSAQWACLSPRLDELMRSRRDPVFVPLPAAPSCTPDLSTSTAPAPSIVPPATDVVRTGGVASSAEFASASAYLTKRQLRCVSRQQGATRIDFSQSD